MSVASNVPYSYTEIVTQFRHSNLIFLPLHRYITFETQSHTHPCLTVGYESDPSMLQQPAFTDYAPDDLIDYFPVSRTVFKIGFQTRLFSAWRRNKLSHRLHHHRPSSDLKVTYTMSFKV